MGKGTKDIAYQRKLLMENEPVLIKHQAFTVIGFSAVFNFGEGYEKCPAFWDKEYSGRFARLFKTMKPETPEEQAVIDNKIGEYAFCRALEGQDKFEYMICGEYQGGNIPEGMKLNTIPESEWLEFKTRGPLPKSLQELNTYVHKEWMKKHENEYQCRGIDLEWYSAGNPMNDDYECGIFIPVVRKDNVRGLCGVDCTSCDWKENCQGCTATSGKPFGGKCVLAECCMEKGLDNCSGCNANCALKAKLIDEFNSLDIPDMPKLTKLNALPGSFINMEFSLKNGSIIKLWDDNQIYLGNQLEKSNGSGRCYGLAADKEYLMVCEYGCDGADPEIIIYKKRK